MKKIIFCLITLFLLLNPLIYGNNSGDNSTIDFSVMSWNVHECAAFDDPDYEFIADIILALSPKFTGIQEAFCRGSSSLYKYMMENKFYPFGIAPCYPENSEGWELRNNGLATFSKFQILISRKIEWVDCNNDCMAAKGFTWARLAIPGEDGQIFTIDFYNLHAESGKGDAGMRNIQLTQLSNFMDEYSQDKSVIVLGDFNVHQNVPIDRYILDIFIDRQNLAMSCPLDQPTHDEGVKLDYILYRSGDFTFNLLDCQVVYDLGHEILEWVSDHFPVVAIFRIYPLPDLVVEDLWTDPINPQEGDSVEVYATVTNIGPGATPKNNPVRVTFGFDNHVFLGNFLVDNEKGYLESGESYTRKCDSTWIISANSCIVKAYIDGLNKIKETNENNNSKFYLACRGIARKIFLISPDGAEKWMLETSKDICWVTNSEISGHIKIDLLKNGQVVGNIINGNDGISMNAGSYTWKVGECKGTPVSIDDNYRIKVSSVDEPFVNDASYQIFSIDKIKPSITVYSPNTGQTYDVGDTIPVTWNATGINADLRIVLRRLNANDEIEWTKVIKLFPVSVDDGNDLYSYNYRVPDNEGIVSGRYSIRVKWLADNNIEAITGKFTINANGIPPLPPEFVVGGQTESFTHGSGDSDFLLYKLGEQGDKIWRENFGGTGNDNGWSVHKTSDGGYVMAGSSDSFTHGGRDFLIYKLDVDGNKQWRKNFGGTQHDDARFIRQTSDGGYIVAGYTRSFSQGQNDFLIYKLNANGNRQWRKNFGDTGDDKARSIYQTMDGGYILIGTSNSFYHGPTVNKDILVYKLDASGHVIWSKNLGGTGDDFGHSVMQTSDGGYIIAGYGNSFTHGGYDALVYKLDANGTKQWRRNYGGTGNDYCYSIVQASDGGYVVAGSSNSSGTHGGYDMVIYKTNSSGYLEETKFFGGLQDDYGYSISNVADGGYIVSGWTKSWVHGPAGVDTDFLVYRLDSDRNKLWKKYLGGIQDDKAYLVK